MRFNTQDLMGTTALAAFYAAGVSVLLRADDVTGIVVVLAVGFFLAFAGAVAAALNAISFSIQAGTTILVVWSPRSWRSHLLVATAFTGLAALVASTLGSGAAALSAYGLLSGVAVHAFLIANSKTSFCERAVIAAGRIRTWKRCRFEVVASGDKHWLAIKTPWYKPNQRVRLRCDRLKEVQQVLAEKQPPMNTDQRG